MDYTTGLQIVYKGHCQPSLRGSISESHGRAIMKFGQIYLVGYFK